MTLPSALLFIADAGHAPEGLPALVGRAHAAGVRFIELRRTEAQARGWGSAALLEEVEACRDAAPEASLIVNDRVDLALASGVAGAHVGQDDLPVLEARRLLGPDRLLGLSTHDEEQFAAALALPLDYVALGPLYLSQTKSGHAEPVGPARLASLAADSALPVVAIGGITLEAAPEIIEAGADALAVISDLFQHPEPRERASAYAACFSPRGDQS